MQSRFKEDRISGKKIYLTSEICYISENNKNKIYNCFGKIHFTIGGMLVVSTNKCVYQMKSTHINWNTFFLCVALQPTREKSEFFLPRRLKV